MVNKRGQIWVETVIYILIALVMIGTVLAFVNPKIEEIRDKLTLDKTVEMLEELDSKISEVGSSVGNQRVINLEIKKGELQIRGGNLNQIIYELKESKVEYSQAEGGFIDMGKVEVQTKENNDLYDVILKLDYTDIYNLESEIDSLTKSSTAYKLSIKNIGDNNIKIELIS